MEEIVADSKSDQMQSFNPKDNRAIGEELKYVLQASFS